MATAKQTALRFTEEDLAFLEALRAKLGVLSTTEVVRMAIRALAERHHVVLKPSRKPRS